MFKKIEKVLLEMVNVKQNRIEIRGLSNDEIKYLKTLAQKNKSKSFNEFLLNIVREKIQFGKFNLGQDLYLAHLENMKSTSEHVLEQIQKQTDILINFREKMDRYGTYISRWLEYEGEVEENDKRN